MSTLPLWIRTSIFGLIIFVIFSIYSLVNGKSFSVLSLNSIVAFTGIFLICSSLAITNAAYFFPSLARFVKYRKYLGVIGFFVIAAHVSIVLLLLSDVFPFPSSFLQGIILYSFFAAVVAFSIFAIMTVISNNKALKMLGATTWRRVLRLGYIALALALFHMIIREQESWRMWGLNLGNPPISVGIAWYGVWTIMLRIILLFTKRK